MNEEQKEFISLFVISAIFFYIPLKIGGIILLIGLIMTFLGISLYIK